MLTPGAAISGYRETKSYLELRIFRVENISFELRISNILFYKTNVTLNIFLKLC